MNAKVEKQERENREHVDNPKVGDYWQECLCPVAVVVSVTPSYVITIENKKTVDSEHWTWDLKSKPKVYTRKEFVFRFTYGYCGGNSQFEGDPDPNSINNRFYCDVMPEQHKWVEKELAACSTVN